MKHLMAENGLYATFARAIIFLDSWHDSGLPHQVNDGPRAVAAACDKDIALMNRCFDLLRQTVANGQPFDPPAAPPIRPFLASYASTRQLLMRGQRLALLDFLGIPEPILQEKVKRDMALLAKDPPSLDGTLTRLDRKAADPILRADEPHSTHVNVT